MKCCSVACVSLNSQVQYQTRLPVILSLVQPRMPVFSLILSTGIYLRHPKSEGGLPNVPPFLRGNQRHRCR